MVRQRSVHNVERANPKERLCFVVGALDGVVFLSYLFEIDQTTYYSIVILLKVILLSFLSFRAWEPLPTWRASFPFLFCLIVAEALSSIANGVALLSTVRVCVFCANLLITLLCVGTYYWRGLLLANAVAAAVYLSYFQAGLITDEFGRYFFFSHSHPNLGGELFFSAAFASMLTNTPRLSLLLIPLFFTPTFLMQGRAAQLGILCSAAVLVWKLSSSHIKYRPIIFFGLATVAMTLFVTMDMSGLASKILMLDDQHRGEGSDFSGRIEYWQTALNMWIENPLLGAGSDYSSRLGVLQPHSFFLYPLASYGIFGLALLFIFFRAFFVVFFSGRALYMLAFIPMLVFNDRFINLNTYPTIMFLYVFSEYARLKFARRRARNLLSGWRLKPFMRAKLKVPSV